MARPVCIGVAGGTGSGKTTVAKAIVDEVGDDILALTQDRYYHDLSFLPLNDRAQRNFDHPESIEVDLLVDNLERLKSGEPAELPLYDFTRHVRLPEAEQVEPKQVILLEGILILAIPEVRALLDVRIFVDTDPDIRFIRRLRRDMAERCRTLESVVEQYLGTVRPMHIEFVEPSKRWADVIIPEGGFNTVAMDLLTSRIRQILRSQVSKTGG
jgi:uridine kinase